MIYQGPTMNTTTTNTTPPLIEDATTNPIYVLRLLLGLSRQQLADELSVNLRRIYDWEDATRFPLNMSYTGWKTLERLTKRALETCPDHPGAPALYEAARSADFAV